jgi:hypothetical protein
MPHRNQPRSLTDFAMTKIIQEIQCVGYRWNKGLNKAFKSDLQILYQKMDSVEKECDELKAVIAGIPYRLAEEMIPIIVKIFSDIISEYCIKIRISVAPEHMLRWEHVWLCMMQTVLHSSMKSLNIVDFVCYDTIKLCLESASCFSKITRLDLSVKTAFDFSEHLLVNLKHLTSLEEFQYTSHCTNEVVEQLSLHCGRMKIIRLRECCKVNTNCVQYLINLRELTVVDVLDCAVTSDGYARLIQDLPKITDVIWGTSFDSILETVSEDKTEKIIQFQASINSAALLVHKCPNIRELSLLNVEDITPVIDLAHLEALSLEACDYLRCNATSVLQAVGHRLIHVTMKQVRDLSIEDIISYCSVAESLHIIECKFSVITRFNETFRPELPHFQHVKYLKWINNKGDEIYVRHLNLYVNIETFYGREVRALDEDVLYNALFGPLAEGGFKRLLTFSARQCGYLGFYSVCMLAYHCDVLQSIAELRYWQGVTFSTLARLKLHFKENNIAVKLKFENDH